MYSVFEDHIYYEVYKENSEIELDVHVLIEEQSSLTTTSFQRPAAAIEEEQENQRACRVINENKVDYHHELIESAVLGFPSHGMSSIAAKQSPTFVTSHYFKRDGQTKSFERDRV